MFIRGISLQFRIIIATFIALSIIISDSRFAVFSQIRMYMDNAISPFYFFLDNSYKLIDVISQILSTRRALELENRILRKELLLKDSELLMLNQYKKENEYLRTLLKSPLHKDKKKIIAQVISIINNPYRNQIIIDKGSVNNVYEGQPVINDKGIVGQVISVSKLTSRVLLICDITHALPIRVLRSDMRMIAVGDGCANSLQLKYIPINVDIRIGDLLVTSGLDGKFPAGYPVAVVSSIKLDTTHTYPIIQARPTADLEHLHYLLLHLEK